MGKKAGIILSYAVFILSGCFIVSPLHRAQSLILSLTTAFITGFLGIVIILKIVEQGNSFSVPKSVFAFFSITSCILAVFISIMLLTEIIKDVAFVANRGISLFYYLSLGFAILLVSYYLCHNSEKGIYRFSMIAALPFLLLFIIIFSSFATTKSVIFDIGLGNTESLISSVKNGAITGLFFTADTSVFLFCFGKYIYCDNAKIPKKQLYLGFFAAFFIITVYNLITVFIFGTELTKAISDPDYALIKLLPGVDMTELISAIRIVSFMIKSSVYIFSSAKAASIISNKGEKFLSTAILSQYLLIPCIITALMVFDNNLGYGAFQHLIYPVTIILSFMFVLINFLSIKKK